MTTTDVRSYCAASDGPDDTDHLLYFLREAQTFTADAASRGHGVVYLIR